MPVTAPDKVQAYKHESSSEGGQGSQDYPFPTVIQPQQDALDGAGLFIQDTSTADKAVLVDRVVNDMRFTDPTNGTVTLAQVRQLEVFLDGEPTAPGNTYSNTISGGHVTQERWVRTSDSSSLKTIDYTYTGNHVTTEVRKVYAANGSTVVAQVTINYTYTGNTVTSAVATRDV